MSLTGHLRALTSPQPRAQRRGGASCSSSSSSFAYSQRGYYLGQMYTQQKFFNDLILLQVGRMTTANNFGSLPVFNDYVSFGISDRCVSLLSISTRTRATSNAALFTNHLKCRLQPRGISVCTTSSEDSKALAAYVIDREDTIRHSYICPDPRDLPDFETIKQCP
jgi:hypothetical protein